LQTGESRAWLPDSTKAYLGRLIAFVIFLLVVSNFIHKNISL